VLRDSRFAERGVGEGGVDLSECERDGVVEVHLLTLGT